MFKLVMGACMRALFLTCIITGPAKSQSLFNPVISVDNMAITKYELNQRIRFFEILQRSNIDEEYARNSLIEDRLKIAAAHRLSIKLSSEVLTQAMSDFAKGTNRDLPLLLVDLAQDGVDEQTFRDYVEVGVTWRNLVRGRFSSRANPTKAEVDRALASTGAQGGIKVLLTEIVLPAPPDKIMVARQIAERLTHIELTTTFSEQARLLSVAPSRENGGRLKWTNLNDLPAGLRPIISGLHSGQVTEPLEIPNAIVLFQLIDVAETTFNLPQISTIKYAQISGPTSAVLLASNRADTCDDFYGSVKKDTALTLTIESKTPDQLSPTIAIRLNGLDKNEQNILQTKNSEEADIVMLCARNYSTFENVSRNKVARNLRSARLERLAEGYLAELRSNSTIKYY